MKCSSFTWGLLSQTGRLLLPCFTVLKHKRNEDTQICWRGCVPIVTLIATQHDKSFYCAYGDRCHSLPAIITDLSACIWISNVRSRIWFLVPISSVPAHISHPVKTLQIRVRHANFHSTVWQGEHSPEQIPLEKVKLAPSLQSCCVLVFRCTQSLSDTKVAFIKSKRAATYSSLIPKD